MKRSTCVALLLILTVFGVAVRTNFSAQEETDPLRSALVKRIDGARQGTGAVIGLLTPEGRSFATYGRVSIGGLEPTPETVFEIGSLTKVFTSFLLADMVERGEVALNDPVRKYLPASVTVPSRRGKEIRLVDLATHASGLPRDSVDVDLSSDNNPYTEYTASDLYAFLGRYRLERDPGTQVAYSNVAVALLGQALALRAGVTYEELLRQRLLDPLGMTSTAITLDAAMLSRRAQGHNPKLQPVLPWTGKVMIPTGAVNSTAADMLKFAAALVDARSPMKAVFARMTSVKLPIENSSREQQALGWGMFKRNGSDLLGHSGATFGFESRLVVDTTRKRAVIAWVNNRSGQGVTELVGLAIDRSSLRD